MATVIFYTNNKKPRDLITRVFRENYINIKKRGHHVVVVSPEDMGLPCDKSVIEPVGAAPSDLYARILRGLDGVSGNETVFLCEDDVVYAPEHWGREISDVRPLYYNLNVVFADSIGFFFKHRWALALSQAYGSARAVVEACENKLREIAGGRFRCYEPTSRDMPIVCRREPYMAIDIRGFGNTTWTPDGTEAHLAEVAGLSWTYARFRREVLGL